MQTWRTTNANSTATLISPYAIIYDYNKLHSCLSTIHTLILIATAWIILIWFCGTTYVSRHDNIIHIALLLLWIVKHVDYSCCVARCIIMWILFCEWIYNCAENTRRMFNTVALAQIDTESISNKYHSNVDVFLNWKFYF